MRLHQQSALEKKQRKTKPQQLRIPAFTRSPIPQHRREPNNPETISTTAKPNKHLNRTLPLLPITKQKMAPERTASRLHSQKTRNTRRNLRVRVIMNEKEYRKALKKHGIPDCTHRLKNSGGQITTIEKGK